MRVSHRSRAQADWLAALLLGGAGRGVSDWNNALKLGFDPETEAYPPWLAAQVRGLLIHGPLTLTRRAAPTRRPACLTPAQGVPPRPAVCAVPSAVALAVLSFAPPSVPTGRPCRSLRVASRSPQLYAPLLPQRVLAPGSPVGAVASHVATATGLSERCLVCTGTTDSIAAFIASGVTEVRTPGRPCLAVGVATCVPRGAVLAAALADHLRTV
jgi:hypothetical protein